MARNTPPATERPTADGVDPITPTPEQAVGKSPDAVDDGAALAKTAPDLQTRADSEAGIDYAVPGSDPSVAEKIKVKTTGNFNLMDPYTGAHIGADDESVEVVKTSFIEQRLASKELEEV